MITMNGIFRNTNTCMNLEETELVKSAQDDLNQFEPLFDRYFDRVFRYIFSRTNDRQVAEDLTSQIFLKILEALPRYQIRGSFAAWVFTIARNTLNSHYRDHFHHPIQSLDKIVSIASNLDVGLVEKIENDDRFIELENNFNRLKEKDRELLRLRYAANLSFREIGALQGKNPDAVKMAIHRLLRRLEVEMELTR